MKFWSESILYFFTSPHSSSSSPSTSSFSSSSSKFSRSQKGNKLDRQSIFVLEVDTNIHQSLGIAFDKHRKVKEVGRVWGTKLEVHDELIGLNEKSLEFSHMSDVVKELRLVFTKSKGNHTLVFRRRI